MNFYFEAAKTLERLDSKQGSIKSILATLPEKDRARTSALVIETLKYKNVLTEVIVTSKLLKEEKKITSRSLALVLVHDLLLSSGIQAADGPIKQAIFRHKTRLHGEFQKIKIKRGASSNLELAHTGDKRAVQIPRYVRINTLLWTVEEALYHFTSRGFELSGPSSTKKGFARDDHISHLLAFNPDLQFRDEASYKMGKVILQDKASCFPAIILDPPADDDAVVIDATAAPGNKTSHLSALMQNKGKLYAFERDNKRFSTLNTMLSKARCKNVETVNADFLSVEPNDPKYCAVSHILLDPSCSGSGIINRLDYLLEAEEVENGQEERLNKLANFQLKMIRHAMKFPSLKKIVYSTCSIHATENEDVVRQALTSEEAKVGRFRLAPPADVLPSWHRRGLPDHMDRPEDASSVIRCSPGEDATNGFFVSCFVRPYVPQGTELLSSVQEGESRNGVRTKRGPQEGDHKSEAGRKRKKRQSES